MWLLRWSLRLSLLCISCLTNLCVAELRFVNVSFGSKYTFVLYDASTTNYFLHTHTDSDGNLYVIGTNDGESSADGVVCRETQSNKIKIGPRGCSGRTKEESLIGNNCARDSQEAEKRKELLETVWSMRPDSDECEISGGDETSCLGPVWLAMDEQPDFTPIVTNESLILSRGVALIGGYGFACQSPTVTWMNVYLPSLIVDTDCTDSNGVSFSATYESYGFDPYEGFLSEHLYAFRRNGTNTQHRLLVTRSGNGTSFVFALAVALDDYEILYSSSETVDGYEWAYQLPLNFTLNSTSDCTYLDVSLSTVTLPLILKPRETLSKTNYFLNRIPGRYEVSSECNHHQGRLDEFGRLFYRSCPEGAQCGGTPNFATPGLANRPIKVVADASYADYEEECESFYPWSSTFRSFVEIGDDGPIQSRNVPDSGICYGPFYNYEAISGILSADDADFSKRDDVKYKQCFALGGWTVGTSKTHCARQSTRRLCRRGWVYFDSFCYYKFDALVDASFRVAQADADAKCKELDSKAEETVGLTTDFSAWLQSVFVGWKRTTPFKSDYRVLLEGRRCRCFGWTEGDPDVASVTSCSCADAVFPVCRYRQADAELPHDSMQMSPESHYVNAVGQPGVSWTGVSTGCNCYDGWTGFACATETCVYPIDLEALTVEAAANSPKAQFFSKCYFKKRGFCVAGQVNACGCAKGYGPPGSLYPDRSDYKFRDVPCSCPATGDALDDSGFEINGVTYRDDIDQHVCGGTSRGACTVEVSSGLSRCVCRTRPDLDPSRRAADGSPGREDAWNGLSCGCRKGMLTSDGFRLNGDLNEGYCNGRGVCCSSGEIQSNQRVSGQDVTRLGRDVCYDRLGNQIDRCVCDDGMTGDACTCPVPKDVALGRTDYRLSFRAYVDLAETRTSVRVVRTGVAKFETERTGCTVTSVTVSAALDGGNSTACAYSEGTWSSPAKWICPENTRGRVVSVFTEEENPTCEIAVYSDTFGVCGDHPNYYAGRFFANEYFRGPGLYLEPQSYGLAPFGCTNTECMCDRGYTGELCKYGISAKLPEGVNAVCGETTLPARGTMGPEGCTCFAESNFRFAGKACECADVYVPELGNHTSCAGHGQCVEADFSWGRCGYDISDERSDPLYSPYLGVSQLRDDSVGRFEISELNGTRSVLGIGGKSWFFSPGQLIDVPTLRGSVNFCEPQVRFPVNVTFQCPDYVVPPVRAVAEIAVWYVDFVCDSSDVDIEECYRFETRNETCDPTLTAAVVDGTSIFDQNEAFVDPTLLCSTTSYCKRDWISLGEIPLFSDNGSLSLESLKDGGWETLECIASQNWIELEGSTEVLQTGTYVNSWFMCANATQINSETNSSSFGVLDCSNPVDRTIDSALFLSGEDRQCGDFPISDYSNVLGAGFGLLWNKITDLSFVSEKWTDDHYRAVGSVISDYFCDAPSESKVGELIRDGVTKKDLYDGTVWDEYVKTWVESVLDTEFVVHDSSDDEYCSTDYRVDDVASRPDNWLYQGLYGSRVLHGTTEGFTFSDGTGTSPGHRAGRVAIVPNVENVGTEIRRVAITAPTKLGGFQVYGPTGEVCSTVLRTVEENETVIVDCLDAFEGVPLSSALKTILDDDSFVNKTETAIAYGNEKSQIVVWFYRYDDYMPFTDDSNSTFGNFRNSDFSLIARNFTYSGLWEQLRYDILVRHRFPRNVPWENRCTNGGGTLRAINYTSDQKEIRDFYHTHLAPRRCTHDSQCKQFARDPDNWRCLPERPDWTMWRNGDASNAVERSGDEGGCRCHSYYSTGFWDPMFFCSKCKAGYGPSNQLEWIAAIEYQNQIKNATGAANAVYGSDFAEAETNADDVSYLNETVYCRFPWDDATDRGTGICGGRGTVRVVSDRTENATFRVFEDQFGVKRIRRCGSIVLDDETTLDSMEEDGLLGLQSFSDGDTTTMNQINGRLFYSDGRELTLGECSDENTCTFGDVAVTCVERVARDGSNAIRMRKTDEEETDFSYRYEDFWIATQR